MNEPQPMGLEPKVQNLVILAFAAQADRTLVRNGAPAQASLDRIEDAVELREEPLPDEAIWTKARERASALFGLVSGEVRKGANMAKLAAELKEKAGAKRAKLADLLRDLRPRAEVLGVPATAPRLATIRSAQALVSDIASAPDPLKTVEVLATAALETSEAAVSRLMAAVEDLCSAVTAASWDIIETAMGLDDHRRAAAEGLREKLAETLETDEHALALKPVIRDIQDRATRLLATQPPSPPPARDEELVVEQPSAVFSAAEAMTALDALRERVATEPASKLTISWRLTRPRQGGHG
jgi:hypothetical protein